MACVSQPVSSRARLKPTGPGLSDMAGPQSGPSTYFFIPGPRARVTLGVNQEGRRLSTGNDIHL